MATIRGIDGRPVVGSKGKPVGRVSHVLFHPREPRVVGFEYIPPRLFYLIERKPRYVRLGAVDVRSDEVRIVERSGAIGSAAEKAQGFSWDDTVIWFGMPVQEVDGDEVGTVGDGDFSPKDGSLRGILLSRGITEDAAVGTREVAGGRIRGFRKDRVLIDSISDVSYDGGVAAAAGRGAAVAGAAAGKAARKAATTAKAAGKAAVHVAKESEAGRKALGALRAFGKKAIDAMGVDEDD